MTGPDLQLQDPRANVEGICGVIETTERFEWICVRPAHASSDRPDAPPNHYMVNRWPNRPVPDSRYAPTATARPARVSRRYWKLSIG